MIVTASSSATTNVSIALWTYEVAEERPAVRRPWSFRYLMEIAGHLALAFFFLCAVWKVDMDVVVRLFLD